MDDTRPFPIQADYGTGGGKTSFVPWWLAEIAYRQYVSQFGKQQSLERLAERGGFGREELLRLLNGHTFGIGEEPICLCPADGFYPLCPIHKTGSLR